MASVARQIGFRFYICLIMISIGFLGLTEPDIMFPGVLAEEHVRVLSWVMVGCSAAGIFDTVLNDVLDHRFDWHLAAQFRDGVYLGMAFCYLAPDLHGGQKRHSFCTRPTLWPERHSLRVDLDRRCKIPLCYPTSRTRVRT